MSSLGTSVTEIQGQLRDGRMWGRRAIVTSDDNVWRGVCLSFRARLRRR